MEEEVQRGTVWPFLAILISMPVAMTNTNKQYNSTWPLYPPPISRCLPARRQHQPSKQLMLRAYLHQSDC